MACQTTKKQPRRLKNPNTVNFKTKRSNQQQKALGQNYVKKSYALAPFRHFLDNSHRLMQQPQIASVAPSGNRQQRTFGQWHVSLQWLCRQIPLNGFSALLSVAAASPTLRQGLRLEPMHSNDGFRFTFGTQPLVLFIPLLAANTQRLFHLQHALIAA